MDVDFWNSVSKLLAMWLGIAAAVLAGVALYTDTIINDRQAARLKTVDERIAQAKTRQVEAETRLSSVEGETATQRERAAEAERKLEHERTKRIELERVTANRWLGPEQIEHLAQTLAKFSGQNVEIAVFPVTFESQGFAGILSVALFQAKWKIDGPHLLTAAPLLPVDIEGKIPGAVRVSGAWIQATPDPESIASAKALHEALAHERAPGAGWNPSPLRGAKRVLVYIGDKPAPLSSRVGKE